MGERLRNGEFYAEGNKIFRAPVWTANDGGGNSVSMGFHACTATDWCEASNIVECLNTSRHHDALVKALEEIATGCDDEHLHPFNSAWAELIKSRAREALAKASSTTPEQTK
jgi:hypothetical protein